MDKLPALITRNNKIYHIADHTDGDKIVTRCRRKMDGFVEHSPIYVTGAEDDRHCPRCGKPEDFEAINAARAEEERQRHEAHLAHLEAVRKAEERANANRPELAAQISQLLDNTFGIPEQGDERYKELNRGNQWERVIEFGGSKFTIKLSLVNGDNLNF